MKQYVACESEEETRKLLERIEKETGIRWNRGEKPTDREPDNNNIGFASYDDGIMSGFDDSIARRVSPDYFILSLKIYELKQKRKALKE
jgi:hypothetical protein